MKPSELGMRETVMDTHLDGGWSTAGQMLGPGIGTVLADTGALPAGWYDFTIKIDVSANLAFGIAYLEHRNAANDASLFRHAWGVTVYYGIQDVITNYKLAANERFRIKLDAGFGGWIQANLFWVRRA